MATLQPHATQCDRTDRAQSALAVSHTPPNPESSARKIALPYIVSRVSFTNRYGSPFHWGFQLETDDYEEAISEAVLIFWSGLTREERWDAIRTLDVLVDPTSCHRSSAATEISICFFIALWYLGVAYKARGNAQREKGDFPTLLGDLQVRAEPRGQTRGGVFWHNQPGTTLR